jgi:hypothetical protein
MSYRRDRAQLLVTGTAYSRKTAGRLEPRFRTQVVNEGRQPIMVTFLMVGTALPRRVSSRFRLVSLWARFLLPLIVRDHAERRERFMRAGRWAIKDQAQRLRVVQLAEPSFVAEDERAVRREETDLPAVVKPGEIFAHDRALDVHGLRVTVVDARYRRTHGPLVLPKSHKATPWNSSGWIGKQMAEDHRERWLRMVDRAFADSEPSSKASP